MRFFSRTPFRTPDLRRVARSVLCLSSVMLLGSVAALQAQPKISIEKSEIELGTIYSGAVVRTPITIANTGNEPLRITSVRTSCGCTTVNQPKETLKPGESATFEVQFNSSGFRGHYTKYVYVQTNDPSAESRTITLRTDIKEELAPVPPVSVAWLGNIAVGKTVTHTIRFANNSGHTLTLKKLTGLPKSVTGTIQPKTLAAKDTAEVRLTVKPDQEGYANTEVKIETSSKNQPQVPFRITYIGVKPE
jgi:Protein of unknown function (DUF1573)